MLESITNIATLNTIVSTAMVVLTAWLAWEARLSRMALQEPQIDAFIQRGEDFGSKLYLVIKNNGQAGAYDLKLKLKEDFDVFKDSSVEEHKKLSYQGPFKNGISFLPPGGTREILLGIHMGEDFEKLILRNLDITIAFTNSFNKRKERKFILSFSELENTFQLPENPLFEIAKSLEKISKEIDDIASGWKKINIITQTKDEKNEEDQQIRKILKEKHKELSVK